MTGQSQKNSLSPWKGLREHVETLKMIIWGSGAAIGMLIMIVVGITLLILWLAERHLTGQPVLLGLIRSVCGFGCPVLVGSLFSGLHAYRKSLATLTADFAKHVEGPIGAMLRLGLTNVYWSSGRGGGPPFAEWFDSADQVDVVLIAGAVLVRDDNIESIRRFMLRNGRLNIVLIEPDNAGLSAIYHSQWLLDPQARDQRISKAQAGVETLHTELRTLPEGTSAEVNIRYARLLVHNGYYRFRNTKTNEERVVVSPIWTLPGKRPAAVPYFEYRTGEMIRNSLRMEIDFLMSEKGSYAVPEPSDASSNSSTKSPPTMAEVEDWRKKNS